MTELSSPKIHLLNLILLQEIWIFMVVQLQFRDRILQVWRSTTANLMASQSISPPPKDPEPPSHTSNQLSKTEDSSLYKNAKPFLILFGKEFWLKCFKILKKRGMQIRKMSVEEKIESVLFIIKIWMMLWSLRRSYWINKTCVLEKNQPNRLFTTCHKRNVDATNLC